MEYRRRERRARAVVARERVVDAEVRVLRGQVVGPPIARLAASSPAVASNTCAVNKAISKATIAWRCWSLSGIAPCAWPRVALFD